LFFSEKHGKLVYDCVVTQEEGKKLGIVMINTKSLHYNSLNISKNTILSCIAEEFSRETVKNRFKQNFSAKSCTKAASKIEKTKVIV